MARDYIDIGCTPADEPCAQVGEPNYESRARRECTRFIETLRRVIGQEPEGAQLMVKSNPHDFGTYYSVVCYFDDNDEDATRYAYRCESDAPTRWDRPSTERDTADRVCDLCLSCAFDQGIPDRESQAMIMSEMGADIEDHICDQVEDPDLGFHCRCACRRR